MNTISLEPWVKNLTDVSVLSGMAALHQDALIWTYVMAEDNFSELVQRNQDEIWRPEWWALRALGVLADEDLDGIIWQHNLPPQDLRQAAAIALALFRAGSKVGWRQLVLSLDLSVPQHWMTILACVFGMSERSAELWDAIALLAAEQGAVLGVHLALTNWRDGQQQREALSAVLGRNSLPEQIIWLREVVKQGRRQMAVLLAKEIVDRDEAIWHSGQQGGIMDWQYQAEVCTLAGRVGLASELLKRSDDALRAQRAELALRQAGIWLHEGDLAQAGTFARSASHCMPALMNDCEFDVLFTEKTAYDVQEQFETWRVCMEQWQCLPGLMLGVDWQREWKIWLRLLLQKGALSEAQQCADRLFASGEADGESFALIGQLLYQMGDLEGAIKFQKIAIATDQKIGFRQQLAHLLEEQGDWCGSLAEREIVYQKAGLDALLLANCALKTGNAQRALEVCEQYLAKNPNDGLANGLSGRALFCLGRLDDAEERLEMATLMHSEEISFWMDWAEIFQQNGKYERAAEILRSALIALPGRAVLLLALGRLDWQMGRFAAALPVLEQVFALQPDHPDVALLLADTQQHLGFVQEALGTLRQARASAPRNADLAALQAEILMLSGNEEGALSSFEVAIDDGNAKIEWLRLYARYALQGKSSFDLVERSVFALRRLLEKKPDDFEGRLLLAKALLLQNELQGAYAVYNQLIDDPELMATGLGREVWLGLGQAALGLKLSDAAVMAFQEAVQISAGNRDELRWLAEAYQQAGMGQEAVQIGRRVWEAEDQDWQTGRWFARLLRCAGQPSVAATVWDSIPKHELQGDEDLLEMAEAFQQANRMEDAQRVLQDIEKPRLKTESLRWLAALWYRMGVVERAVEYLEPCAQDGTQPVCLLALELAWLYGEMEQWPLAIQHVEVALRHGEQRVDVLVWAADLLAKAGRWSVASKVLEQALAFKATESVWAWVDERDYGLAMQLWGGAILIGRGEVLLRLTRLAGVQGNLRRGLEFAQQGLEEMPQHLLLRYLGAEMALAQMQPSLALQFADFGSIEPVQDGERQLAAACMALCGEIALRRGQVGLAEGYCQRGWGYDKEFARLVTLKSRLHAWQGKFWMGNDTFELAVMLLRKSGADAQRREWLQARSLLRDWNDATSLLWLADALVDLHRWREALQFLDKAVKKLPGRADVRRLYWRAATDLQTKRWLYRAIRLSNGLPGDVTEVLQEALQHGEGEASLIRAVLCPMFDSENEPVRFLTVEEAQAAASAWAVSENWSLVLQSLKGFEEDRWVRVMVAFAGVMRDGAGRLLDLNEAVQSFSTHPLIRALLACAAERCGEWGMALDAVQSALQLWPGRPEWMAWAAELCGRLGKNDEALMYWEQATQLSPQSTDYKWSYAITARQSGRVALAIRLLRDVLGMSPETTVVWFELALAYQQSGDLDSALTCAERIFNLKPDWVDGLILAGRIALEMGRLDEALRYAGDAVHFCPKSQDALTLLVEVWLRRGRSSEALNALEYAHELCRRVEVLGRKRASLITQLRGTMAGQSAYQQLSHDFPNSAGVLADWAFLLAELGQLDEAVRLANRAFRLDPERFDLALFLGKRFRQNGQLDRAIYFFGEAARRNPKHLETYLELGQTYQQQRQHGLALDAFEVAMKLAPQDYRAFHWAGLARRDAKDYPMAESLLRQAVQLAPREVSVRRQLAAVIALNMVQTVQELER